ncbi:hypothetical protein D5S17_35015 [Pseudonocardiaceae bacterium YIM PH 21723]|nr:hypothetical protein D5S17_35015 [Pseudonocardiaceae bacterium YIM PH 21723]
MGAVMSLSADQLPATRAVEGYVAEVARAVGVGPEACTFDYDSPVSAYIAVDYRLPMFPSRDFALMWDEETGWAGVVESACGMDLINVGYLGGTIAPPARRVAQFVAQLRGAEHLGPTDPPTLRLASGLEDLHRELDSRCAA